MAIAGARDHALRDGLHVRPRRPRPPPLPVGPIADVPYFRRVAAAHQVRSGNRQGIFALFCHRSSQFTQVLNLNRLLLSSFADTSYGQVRRRALRPVPWPQGQLRFFKLISVIDTMCRLQMNDHVERCLSFFDIFYMCLTGAEGGGRHRGAGEGDQEEDEEERDLSRCCPMKES